MAIPILSDIRLPSSGKLYLWTGHNDNFLKYDHWQASASAGMTIENISGDGEIYFKSGNDLALTLDTSQNANFYGDVNLSSAVTPKITLTDTTNNLLGRIRVGNTAMYIDADAGEGVDSTSLQLQVDAVTKLSLTSTINRFQGSNVSIRRDDTVAVLNFERNDSSIVSGNDIGQLIFKGADPSGWNEGARISVEADGTWDTDTYPSRIKFDVKATDTSQTALKLESDMNAVFGGSLQMPGYITHTGDADTKIGFNVDDTIELRCGGNLQINADVNRAYLRYQGTAKLYTDNTGVNFFGHAYPNADSTYDLGKSDLYWAHGYIDAITTTGAVTVGGLLTHARTQGTVTESALSGTATASAKLTTNYTYDGTNNSGAYARQDYLTLAGTGGSFANVAGYQMKTDVTSTGTSTAIKNIMSRVHTASAGDINNVACFVTHNEFSGTGNVGTWAGLAIADVGGGFENTQTVTNTYGIKIGDITHGTQTNAPFAIHTGAEKSQISHNVLTTTGSHGRIHSVTSSLFLGGEGTTLVQLSGKLIPDADSSHDLGQSNRYWKDAYIDTITTTGDVDAGGDISADRATFTKSSGDHITIDGRASGSYNAANIYFKSGDSAGSWNAYRLKYVKDGSNDRLEFIDGSGNPNIYFDNGGAATFAGTINATDGNATTPAYNFSSHDGNGMYLEDYDASNNKEQVSIATDGIRRMRVNEAGVWTDQNFYVTGDWRTFSSVWHATAGTSGAGFRFENTHTDHGDIIALDLSATGNATFAGDVTVEGGILYLGKADVASGHINSKELMTFNIDTDDDDTNRYFGFYINAESGSGTELLKILETAETTFTAPTSNSLDILNLKSGADNVDEYLGLTFTTGVGGTGPHGAIRVYNGPSASDAYMSFLTTSNGGTSLTAGLTLDHLGAATFVGNVTASSGTGHFSNVNSSSYQLNGTYVMDSSRNLVNIGTIASGAITVTGGSNQTVIDADIAFDLTDGSKDTLLITNTKTTSAIGAIGPSIGFGNMNSDRRTSAIGAIRTGDDHDNMGLAFFTHPANDNNDTVVKQFELAHDGKATFTGKIVPNAHIEFPYGQELRTLDSGGTVRTIARASSNKLQYGWSYAGEVEFMGGGSYTPKITINTDGSTTFADAIVANTPNGKWRVNDYGAMYFRNSSNDTHESYIHSRSDGSLSIGRVAESDWTGTGNAAYAATTYDHVTFDTTSNATFASKIIMPDNKAVEWSGGSIRAEGNTLKLVATTLIDLQDNTQVQGDLTVTGDLNITGDINSTSVTNLDVDDKTITVAKGAADSETADGAGIVVDGADASLLYDHTGTQWESNKPFEVKVGSSAITLTEYSDGATIWLDGSNGDFTGGDYFNISAYGTTDLAFGYAAAAKMTLKNTGWFGIGTDDPAMKLEVFDTGDSGTAIGIGNSGTGASRLYMDASNGDYSGSDYMWIGQNNDKSGEIFMAQSSGSFHIKTQPSGTITTQFLVEQAGHATFSQDILTNTDSSSDIGKTDKRWANVWADNFNGGSMVTGTGADNYLAVWNGTTGIDHDTDFYVDASTLYTNALRITSDNAFYRETINSNTGGESWTASTWHRIIEITGGHGRGKCHFLIQTGGGSGTPCRVEAIVNTAWSNNNATLTILHSSYPNFITDIRVVRNSTSAKSFIDIKGTGEDYVDVTILPDGSTSAAIVNFTDVDTLPTGDSKQIEKTITNMIMSLATGTGTDTSGEQPFQVKYDGSIFAEQATFNNTVTINPGNNRIVFSEGSNSIAQIGLRDSATGEVFLQGWGSDFRVAVNNDASNHALKITNGKHATFYGKLGIGVDPTTLLHLNGSGDAIRVESTNTGSAGAQIDLLHFTTSPADDDITGLINFGGYYSGTDSAYSSSIRSVWTDVSEKHGQLEFWTRDGDDWAQRLRIDHDGTTSNTGDMALLPLSSTHSTSLGVKGYEPSIILTKTRGSSGDDTVKLTVENDAAVFDIYKNNDGGGNVRMLRFDSNNNIVLNGSGGNGYDTHSWGGSTSSLTIQGTASTTGRHYVAELDLPSGAQIDWANGDARIVEAASGTNNYSLSFQTYDGSACSTALRLEGNNEAHFQSDVYIPDGKGLLLGTSGDAFIKHTGGSGAFSMYNDVGAMNIVQRQDDGNIVFTCDDGNNGLFDYFSIDGGSATYADGATTAVYTKWQDKSRIALGTGKDLQLYHDGSNSFIQNSTGSLVIEQAAGAIALRPVTGENGILIVENAAVSLYYNNSSKLQTTDTGINVTGHADMDTGNVAGKFAVMSAAVHGSYDLYNNGTTYFNGATTLDDNVTITGATSQPALDVTGEISASDDINTPTKVVIGESATAELRLKKTDAGTGTIRFYNNDGSDSTSVAYIQLDASEDLVYYRPANGKHQFYGSGSHRLEIGGDVFVKGSTDFGVPSGRRIKFDVDTHGHTYIMEEGDNNMKFYVGGAEHMAVGGGNVTISPSSAFTVDAGGDITLDAAGNDIRFFKNGTEYGKFKSDSSDFAIYSSVENKDIILRGNDAGTTVDALTLDMSEAGKATFNNDVIAFSDKKLKKNIKTLDGSKVYDMRGVSFTRIDTNKSGAGVIAQEMQEVAPELVNETNGTLGVSYGNITGYLIEAIKDLKAEIEDLKKQIK